MVQCLHKTLHRLVKSTSHALKPSAAPHPLLLLTSLPPPSSLVSVLSADVFPAIQPAMSKFCNGFAVLAPHGAPASQLSMLFFFCCSSSSSFFISKSTTVHENISDHGDHRRTREREPGRRGNKHTAIHPPSKACPPQSPNPTTRRSGSSDSFVRSNDETVVSQALASLTPSIAQNLSSSKINLLLSSFLFSLQTLRKRDKPQVMYGMVRFSTCVLKTRVCFQTSFV